MNNRGDVLNTAVCLEVGGSILKGFFERLEMTLTMMRVSETAHVIAGGLGLRFPLVE
jgi:hypothetical protein